MAAPAPATVLVASLANAAATAQPQLHFDVALANNTQLTVGRPGPPPAAPNHCTIAHNAPPPAPGPGGFIPPPPFPPCSDRAHHLTTANTGPCLSTIFNPGLAAFPGAGLSFPVQAGTDVRLCAIPGPLHLPPYAVCLHCVRNIRRQRWSRAIWRDITVPPADLPRPMPTPQPMTLAAAPPGFAVWTKFMTHLCESCEREEMLILYQRAANPAAPNDAVPTRRGYSACQQWPYVTCTCLQIWHEDTDPSFPGNGFEVCIRHRHRRACERHDKLLIIRNQNDKWLRETAKDRNNPNRIIRLRHNNIGHLNIMNGRANRGSFRACRCGAEPRTGLPRVWMCLGCEGVIHNVVIPPVPPGPGPPGHVQYTLPPQFANVLTRRAQQALTGVNRFPLRRARH